MELIKYQKFKQQIFTEFGSGRLLVAGPSKDNKNYD